MVGKVALGVGANGTIVVEESDVDGYELSNLDGGAVMEVEGGLGRDVGFVKNDAMGM